MQSTILSQDKPLSYVMMKTRRTMMYAGIFSFAINLLMLAMPLYSLQVMDKVLSSHSMETLTMLTIIVVAWIFFLAIFTAVRSFILNSITEWLDRELAPLLLSDAISKSSLGARVNAAQHQRDLASIKNFISSGGFSTLLDAPWSIIFIFVTYMLSPMLGFICVVGVIILVGFGIINEVATKKIYDKASRESILTQQLADTASRNSEAIQSMGMMENILAQWKKIHLSAMEHQIKGAHRANIVQAMSRFLRLLIQIAVTGFSCYLIMKNELTMGGMIATGTLVGRALAPFEGAISLWKTWISTREAYRRLDENLGRSKMIERGTVELPMPHGTLSVENVIYTPARSAPIIKGVSFVLPAGEGLGIIGPSAAGKSTLSRLIMGLIPPTHGAIRLDGAETFKWMREDFGKYVGYLPQNVDLFPGTIKDNIARMDLNASMEEVIAAAQMANAHELILRLPKGYETECGDANLNLSPGQRQRVGLARALYNKPKFVLLDEPNSNLDGEGERALIDALRKMKLAGITFVVVAHRPTIVSTVDKLLVLRAGTVERFGPRDEILKQYTGSGGQPAQAIQQAVS